MLHGLGAMVGWNHLKEIPNTKLFVSLHRYNLRSAKLKIFDVSTKEKAREMYSFEEVSGGSDD